MTHDIFISYAHADKPSADAVCVTLEARGFRCWIAPRDVMLSTNYASAIVSAIEQSRLLLLIVSSHSNASPHVEREVELALSKKIPTLPMFIENVEPSPAIGYFLGASQRFYALDQPLQSYLNLLAEQMSLILTSGAARPAMSAGPDAGTAASRSDPIQPPPSSASTGAGAIPHGIRVRSAMPPSERASVLPVTEAVPKPVAASSTTPPDPRRRKAILIGGVIGAAVALGTFVVFLAVGPVGALIMGIGAGFFAWLLAAGIALSVLERQQ